ncbi:MAG: hypothetical protein QOK40_1831, partial [Miltoncostaeaceae bacterium]|nr:hypothetical protein [Miltoncostaeaceae bacterium]
MVVSDRPISDAGDERGRRRTALVSVGAACLLVALKLGAGLATGSLGLVAAGIESSGDVLAAILTVGALRMAGRPADQEHPYGHRRAENLAALGEAAILAAGALIIANEAIGRVRGGGGSLDARWYVFAVIGAALCVDASRAVISRRTARRYRSAALRSNAFHFAADFIGSLAVLAGLVLVRAGVEQGDAVAALIVSAIILAASGRLVSENAGVLMDRAPAAAEQRAREAIEALGGEIELRRLRVRESAGRVFADAVVAVPPARAVIEGHELADRVEAAVAQALPGADVVVHVEPRQRDLDLREGILAIALSDPLVREVHNLTIYEHGPRRSASLHLKLPAELSLAEAHEVAERVERAVAAEAGVEVQTHLEPLERPLALQPGAGVPHGALERAV